MVIVEIVLIHQRVFRCKKIRVRDFERTYWIKMAVPLFSGIQTSEPVVCVKIEQKSL